MNLQEISQIKQEQATLAAITANLPALVSYVGPDERYLFVNQAYADWFGLPRSEIVGKTVGELWGETAYKNIQASIQRTLAGEVVNFETQLNFKNSLYHFEGTFAPQYNGTGQVAGFVALIRDITERKRAEQTRLFLLEAGTLLSSTLDYEVLLTRLTRLCLPILADYCLLDLLDEHGNFQRTTIAHIDPAKEKLLWEMQKRFPPTWENSPLLAETLKTGQPILLPKISEADWQAGALNSEYYEFLRQMEPVSLLILPLTVRERRFGALTLLMSPRSQRHYGQPELELGVEIARRAALVLENSRLYQAERKAHQRAERLQAVTAALAETFTPAEVIDVVVREGVAALGTAAGLVALLTEDGTKLEIMGHVGYPLKFIETWQTIPLAANVPLTEAVREQRPIWLGNFAGEQLETKYPSLNSATRLSNSAALAVIPLSVERQIIGVIGLSFTEPRFFSEEDKVFMLTLSRQCAQALERAKLYQAEQLSRKSIERVAEQNAQLQSITAAFSEALTPQQVIEIIIWQGSQVLDALSSAVFLLNSSYEPLQLELAQSHGLSVEITDHWQKFSIQTPTLVAEASRTGQPILLRNWAALSSQQNYPTKILEALRGHQAFAALPMLVQGQTIGAISFTFAQEQSFDTDNQNFLMALATRCAQALERARLYESEKQSRREAESSRQQLAFLAEAGRLLTSSLEYEETLTSLARLVVPAIADWCSIDVLEADLAPVIVHSDPAKEKLITDLLHRFALEAEIGSRAAWVMQTGQTIFRPLITPEMLEAEVASKEQRELLAQVGFASFICVPLVAREQVLGALTLVRSAETGKSYTAADMTLAEELAQRAATAIDNARLYRQAREAVKMRDEFLSIAAHELKTPITSLKGYSQLVIRQLNRGDNQPDLQRVLRALQVIESQSDKLSYLVSQLLDISRLEAGRMQLDWQLVNLNTLVDNLINAIRPTIPTNYNLQIQASGEINIWLDPLRFEQVLTNLINNAVKYSPDGGPIWVELNFSDKLAQVSVTDQGLGIAPEHRSQLFERFYQAHPGNFTHGMGLGLYISRQIIELHKGTIEAEFPANGGTRFVVKLPPRNLASS